jgi:hypothetical protein
LWTYRQATGELLKDGRFIAQGYSGKGHGKNNPAAETEKNVGPIPAGAWSVAALTTEMTAHGPYVLHLSPCNGTQTHGRSGFLMHGDNRQHPGEASEGCIIMQRAIREKVWESGDRVLTVTT